MAHTKLLSPEVLAGIADQIGARLAGFSDAVNANVAELETNASRIDLGETFELWTLPSDVRDEVARGLDLTRLARSSGLWHHQIRSNNEALSFARSKPLGATADSWSLREVFESPLAADISHAIDWIEANVPDDVEVRLLTAPAYQVDAFWLIAADPSPSYAEWNDRILIIRSARFTALQLLSAEEFLRGLLEERPGSGLR